MRWRPRNALVEVGYAHLFAGEFIDEAPNSNAIDTNYVDSQVVLRVGGELDPLLRMLARHSVKHLSFPEPSLEEAFIGLYRNGDGDGS